MPLIPDVVQLGPLPLNGSALMLLAGTALALLAAGRRAGPSVQDLLISLLFGGFLGAKLLYVALDPVGLAANPLGLLILPQGPLAAPGAAVGATLAAAWSLRRRPDRLAVLDRAAAPLVLGLAVAALGWRGPGEWVAGPALAVAAVAAFVFSARRPATRPGHTAATTLIMACLALALADLARPASAALFGGVTLTQLVCAASATAAWAFISRRPPQISQ